jgi:hypothetical protein
MQLQRADLELHGLIQENYTGTLTMHKFMNLTESDKVSISKGLIDQIYVTIAERYNSINFEMVPKSLGKIKTMKEYENLRASIDLLIGIANESKQPIPEVEIIRQSLDNLVMFEEAFFTGYMKKNAPIIMTYNLLAMAVFCSTSLMISVLVDFINQGASGGDARPSESVDIIINQKYKRHQNYLMIDALKKFNDQVGNGSFAQTLQTYNRQNAQNLNESAILTTGLVIIGIVFILKFIPLVKELIYLFYYTRLKLSDALAIQADLINGNIEALKNKGVSKDSKIFKIQKWFSDKLTDLSNKFAFTYEKGEKQAEIESRVKLTPEDVMLF